MKRLANALALFFCSHALAHAAAPVRVETVESQKQRYTVVHVDLRQARVEMFWKDRRGQRFGSLGRLRRAVGARLLAAMNAGIYEPGYIPEGLHIQYGHILRPLNTQSGKGNFYTKPSGVFYTRKGGDAHILSTDDYARTQPDATQATQSGPLLVYRGKLHPLIRPTSTSRYIRNGVGIVDEQHIVLVLSEGAVTLHEFAQLFRESLHCPNALYLDGSISGLYAATAQPPLQEGRWGFAGILGIVTRER